MPLYASQQKKQKYMIWVFMAVLIITGTVIYFGFLKDKIKIGGVNVPVFNPVGADVRDININFDILDKEEFKKLTPFDDARPFSGKVGREEPFKPNQ